MSFQTLKQHFVLHRIWNLDTKLYTDKIVDSCFFHSEHKILSFQINPLVLRYGQQWSINRTSWIHLIHLIRSVQSYFIAKIPTVDHRRVLQNNDMKSCLRRLILNYLALRVSRVIADNASSSSSEHLLSGYGWICFLRASRETSTTACLQLTSRQDSFFFFFSPLALTVSCRTSEVQQRIL